MATQKTRAPWSHDEIRDLVRAAVGASVNDAAMHPYVYDLWGDASSGVAVYYLESGDANRPSSYVEVDYVIDDTGGVTLANAKPVRRTVNYVPVKMSASEFTADFVNASRVEGGSTIVTARVFRLGDYPDKDFSLSAQEFDERVLPSFRPVPVLFEHGDTVLTDGDEFNAGALRRIWRVGDVIYGEVSVRQWVVDALGRGATPPVSISFDRATKSVCELSLVRNPRVADASVVTPFSDEAGARRWPAMEWLKTLFLSRDQMPGDVRAAFDAGAGIAPIAPPAAPQATTSQPATFTAEQVAHVSTAVAEFAQIAAGRVPAAQSANAAAIYAHLLGPATFDAAGALQVSPHAAQFRDLIASLPQFGAELTAERLSAAGAVQLGASDVQKPAAGIDASAIYAAFNAKEGK
jgi:hypothetical protein